MAFTVGIISLDTFKLLRKFYCFFSHLGDDENAAFSETVLNFGQPQERFGPRLPFLTTRSGGFFEALHEHVIFVGKIKTVLT